MEPESRDAQPPPAPEAATEMASAASPDFRVTPKPPAGVGLNPLKDLGLTEGQHLDFLPPALDFLPTGLEFLPPSLEFLPPSLEFLPSGLEPLPCGLAGRPRLGSPLVPAGGGRLGSNISGFIPLQPLDFE
jgi:hypothetical protein